MTTPENNSNPQAPQPLTEATIDELEVMLQQAEDNLQAIYAELEERRREQMHNQFEQLPQDMSSFKGSWRNLVTAFRNIAKDEN
ncbi:MAG TPA: hypothetical protein H9867_10260 [Candidatus Corynebacterium gallistercoris]|uniref:Uncharacterized protein n=1 Tax=Candidatus Corynebacterium gallistercoris TaxID=2838530 RepID=A0A9D1UQU4_9CORY|nr:hypothetical protein [Candidatus Corynebacterium gallistercoris]